MSRPESVLFDSYLRSVRRSIRVLAQIDRLTACPLMDEIAHHA